MVVKVCGRVPVSVYIVGESTVDGQVRGMGLGVSRGDRHAASKLTAHL